MKFDITIKDCTVAEMDRIVDAIGRHIDNATLHDDKKPSFPETINHPHFDSEKPPAPVATGHADVDAALAAQYDKLKSPAHAPITPTAPEFDASGLAWDERIHASTKTKTAKGMWKCRRGVDDASVTAVEAELRGHYAPNSVAVTTVVPPAPPIPDASTMFTQPATIPPAPPAPPVIPGSAPAAPIVNFGTLMNRITQGYMLQKIGTDYPTTLCVRTGYKFNKQISTITDIMNDQAMIEFADSLITADNAGF